MNTKVELDFEGRETVHPQRQDSEPKEGRGRGSWRSASLIREMTPEERPRQRLLNHGAESLADADLLAILLRTGCRGVSALDLARALLAECERRLRTAGFWRLGAQIQQGGPQHHRRAREREG